MIYQKLSKRQLLAATWWNRPKFRDYDGIICDGAVRSGKTVWMAVGFLLWAMSTFDGCTFGICGKTIESLRRNVVMNLPNWLGGTGLTITEKRSENKLIVTVGGRTNTFFLFGGRDESSYTLIQGITLAGIFLDEAALMPRSFVEQACARCSVAGSKMWFNCNPAGPEHWFYKEWVLRAKELKILHLHFTMADNLSLAPEIRQRYEKLYTGVFYRRYILGEWCMAEGLVYNFDKERSMVDVSTLPPEYFRHGEWYVSIDYGTRNPFSAGLWFVSSGKALRVREYYYSGRENSINKTDEEYYRELEKLTGDIPIRHIIIDPSAASFIATIRSHGKYSVRPAKNDVLPGIRFTSNCLQAGVLLIGTDCKDTEREFGLYRWDDRTEEDKVIKENDHAMDETRYFCYTVLRRNRETRRLLGEGAYLHEKD